MIYEVTNTKTNSVRKTKCTLDYVAGEILSLQRLTENKVQCVPRFYGAFENDSYVMIVMKGFRPLLEGSFGNKTKVSTEIIECLKNIHDANVVHRDINPDNIMVDENGHIKFIDFGFLYPSELREFPSLKEHRCINHVNCSNKKIHRFLIGMIFSQTIGQSELFSLI